MDLEGLTGAGRGEQGCACTGRSEGRTISKTVGGGLWKWSVIYNATPTNRCTAFAQGGSPEVIRDEWEKGREAGQYPSIDIPNGRGKTLLQLAAALNGNPESIKMLVDLGASLGAGEGSNATPGDLVKLNPNLSPEDLATARKYLSPS